MKRRDFLQGVGVSLAAGTLSSPVETLNRSADAGAYPPALTGLRGAHVGSFEVAHDLAWNGRSWPRPIVQTDDTYDLVVVGGGISGLAAAYFYRERVGPDARILVLDNHDDFGGHAKRNEFTAGGRMLIGYGGSQSIDTPRRYSIAARRLIAELGIDTRRFATYFDRDFETRHGLTGGVRFDAATYGADRLLRDSFSWFDSLDAEEGRRRISRFPMDDDSRAAIARLATGEINRNDAVRAMVAAAHETPTEDFLRAAFGLTDPALALMRRRTGPLWGAGLDTLSVAESVLYGMLGRAAAEAAAGFSADELPGRDESQPYIFHFPDGNATIARLLVRSLVPGSIPGRSMEDIVTATVDYGALDKPSNGVRIRLDTTAVRAENRSGGVDVTCVRRGEISRVGARDCVLACYNAMVPYLCPQIGAAQREALDYPEKVPLMIVNVALNHWRPIADSGIARYYAPNGLLCAMGMDFPVSMGGYGYTRGPSEPCVLQGWSAPACDEPGDVRERFRAGRTTLYVTPFGEIERRILDELDSAWGSHGLDVERDVAAMTVNRWPHGYAYEYMDLWDDPAWGRGAGPHVIGRQQIGRMAIANSDSESYAYVNGAIDAAYRAVRELTT